MLLIFLARPNQREPASRVIRRRTHSVGLPHAKASVHRPNARRLLFRISSEIRATFTSEQIQAIEAALIPRSHIIDFRLSLPFLSKGSCLALAARPNRRTRNRNPRWGNPFIMPAVFISILVGTASIFGLVHLKGSELLAKPDQFTKKKGFYPTTVPFKTNRGECEESSRQWIDSQCIDTVHNPVF